MPLPGNLLFQDPNTSQGLSGMDPMSFLSMLVAQGIRPAGMTAPLGGEPSAPGIGTAGSNITGTAPPGGNPALRALGAVQAAAPSPPQTIMPAAAPRPDASAGLRGSQLAQMMAMLMGGAGAGRGGAAQPTVPTLSQLIAGR